MHYRSKQSGFSLVEAIVVAALSVMIFGALFSSFQYTLQLINNSRSKLSAISIANDRMEYFRSLPYDEVGTIAGIPPGTIPQNSTTTLNGIEFQERVLVEYVDDAADGVDSATSTDSNGIPADYKRVKVEYTWNVGNGTSSISLISNIVPRSIETTAGGGTVRINVIDENSQLLPGATVRLINNTATTTIDTTRTTDTSGAALFSGAPAGSGYEVIVTATIGGEQYSTAQTYQATTSNPNPTVAPFAVLEADVSTLTFQIGELSDVDVRTYSSITEGSVVNPYDDSSLIATSTNVAVASGKLRLTNTAGSYSPSGVAYTEVTPGVLEQWEVVRVGGNNPVGTERVVRLYTGTATSGYVLVPDADLSGNSTGFTTGLIAISSLDVVAYPALAVGVTLETSVSTQTPEVDDLAVFYRESSAPRSGVPFTMYGTKLVGTNSSSSPIYKVSESFTTDGAGEYAINDLEFDAYTITNQNGLDVASACPSAPYVHQAGVDQTLEYILVGDSANTARITVRDTSGGVIPGAAVTLSRPGYNVTIATNSCGQSFFTGGVSLSNDYDIVVSVPGYTVESIVGFAIDGDAEVTVTMTN